mmetsp:Transcript_64051/g.139302  ORF Transcript_64051/g.139302 Transcript_64051/m.139302 type:complete len:201 (-) Transcript_64051:541-1143(-)
MHYSHVLGDIAGQDPELRILVDESLHLLNGLYFGCILRVVLVLLYILLNAHAQVAEVSQAILLEERILLGRHDDLSQLWPNIRHPGHINAIILHREQLMEHRLVRPLVQQRRHWIVSAIQEYQHRRNCIALPLSLHRLEEAVLLGYPRLQTEGHLPTQVGGGSVSDGGQHSQSEAYRKQPLNDPLEDALLIRRPPAMILC